MKHDDCHIAAWIPNLTIGLTDIKPDNVSWNLNSKYEKCATHERLERMETIDLTCSLPYPRGRYLFVSAESGQRSFVLAEVEVYDSKLGFSIMEISQCSTCQLRKLVD